MCKPLVQLDGEAAKKTQQTAVPLGKEYIIFLKQCTTGCRLKAHEMCLKVLALCCS